jgi:hypothetical protein
MQSNFNIRLKTDIIHAFFYSPIKYRAKIPKKPSQYLGKEYGVK